jgi:3-dehydroquinate synthase
MLASFEVGSASGSYAVDIQPGGLRGILAQSGDTVVLADAYFANRLGPDAPRAIWLPALETSKTLDQISQVIIALRTAGASRKTTLIAVGGGIVQDIAGFVSSVYMRGIAWVYVPTTLLAMVDSCIGGKSSINVGPYKNLVGTFHPPRTITIDPDLCASLSVEQRVAGLCEAAKITFCHGQESFEAYGRLAPTLASEPDRLSEVIALSLAAKKWYIETDEFDRAERLQLNFGHTFGHAIESASDFRISHGVAVGLGMMSAGVFARSLGRQYRSGGAVEQIESHISTLLACVPDLPQAVAAMTGPSLMRAFKADKKHSAEQFSLVLPKTEGMVEHVSFTRTAETEARIGDAFAAMKARYAS